MAEQCVGIKHTMEAQLQKLPEKVFCFFFFFEIHIIIQANHQPYNRIDHLIGMHLLRHWTHG